MAADRSALVRLCRAALEQAARAEQFTMAEWLTVRPDGRTVKAAYAEAARLACELRAHADADAPRQRERRPALVLTRELRECLERIVARVERGEAPPAGTEEALTDVEALLSGHR